MGFKKGEGGRPKGARNRRTKEAKEIAQAKGFSPIEALIYCYHEAVSQYQHYKDLLMQNRISPMEDNGAKYLKIASDNAKEVGSFIYPKLKSIDHNLEAEVDGDIIYKTQWAQDTSTHDSNTATLQSSSRSAKGTPLT